MMVNNLEEERASLDEAKTAREREKKMSPTRFALCLTKRPRHCFGGNDNWDRKSMNFPGIDLAPSLFSPLFFSFVLFRPLLWLPTLGLFGDVTRVAPAAASGISS